ncbi:MAG: hypothetical protein KDK66_02300 [Deltaproteobacteria bacterium]|nr:hypothetical protein [Deltaproteobacteria bacterium]
MNKTKLSQLALFLFLMLLATPSFAQLIENAEIYLRRGDLIPDTNDYIKGIYRPSVNNQGDMIVRVTSVKDPINLDSAITIDDYLVLINHEVVFRGSEHPDFVNFAGDSRSQFTMDPLFRPLVGVDDQKNFFLLNGGEKGTEIWTSFGEKLVPGDVAPGLLSPLYTIKEIDLENIWLSPQGYLYWEALLNNNRYVFYRSSISNLQQSEVIFSLPKTGIEIFGLPAKKLCGFKISPNGEHHLYQFCDENGRNSFLVADGVVIETRDIDHPFDNYLYDYAIDNEGNDLVGALLPFADTSLEGLTYPPPYTWESLLNGTAIFENPTIIDTWTSSIFSRIRSISTNSQGKALFRLGLFEGEEEGLAHPSSNNSYVVACDIHDFENSLKTLVRVGDSILASGGFEEIALNTIQGFSYLKEETLSSLMTQELSGNNTAFIKVYFENPELAYSSANYYLALDQAIIKLDLLEVFAEEDPNCYQDTSIKVDPYYLETPITLKENIIEEPKENTISSDSNTGSCSLNQTSIDYYGLFLWIGFLNFLIIVFKIRKKLS